LVWVMCMNFKVIMALLFYKKSVKWLFQIFYFLAYFPYFEKDKKEPCCLSVYPP
jgi:hypothetical protein